MSRDATHSVPFLLVSWTTPPTATGSSVIVRNLAAEFGPTDCVLLGQLLYDGRIGLDRIEDHVRVLIPSYPIHWRLKPYLEPFYAIPMAVRAGCAAVRDHGLRAVVAVYPNSAFMVAGYLIARLCGVPFYPWFHNLYVETRPTGVGAAFARIVQRHILARAAHVFGMSDGVSRFLQANYGIEGDPLLHPVSLPIPEAAAPPDAEKPFVLGLSGNINFTTAEPLRNLIAAVGDSPDYRIVLHTLTPEAGIRETLGVWADNVSVRPVPDASELVLALSECDALVLGLGDRTGKPMEWDFKTQFPTRTLEMLVSERPILLMCPDDYFLAEFFAENGCGRHVSATDAEAIGYAVREICADRALRSKCVAGALHAAARYRAEDVAESLQRRLREGSGESAVPE